MCVSFITTKRYDRWPSLRNGDDKLVRAKAIRIWSICWLCILIPVLHDRVCELISNRKIIWLSLYCAKTPSIGVTEFLLDAKVEEEVVFGGGPFKGLALLIIKPAGGKEVTKYTTEGEKKIRKFAFI